MSVHVLGPGDSDEGASDAEGASSDVEVGVDITPTTEDLSKQEERLRLRYGRSELINLMREARRKGFKTRIKAETCKIINWSFLIFLAVCDASLFILSSISPNHGNLPIIIVSGVTFAVVIFYGLIGPGARGSYYNQISIRLRGMYRNARESYVKLTNSEDMIDLVHMNMAEMDQMDLNIYSMGIGNGNTMGNGVTLRS